MHVEVRRHILMGTLPGDWADKSSIPVYLPDDDSDANAGLRRACRQASDAILSSLPSSFPSRGWTRCSDAPEWIGLSNIHGITEEAYPLFTRLVGDQDPQRTIRQLLAVKDGEDDLLAAMFGELLALPDAQELYTLMEADLPPVGDTADAEQPAAAEEMKRREQAGWRRSVLEWIAEGTMQTDLSEECIWMQIHMKYQALLLYTAGKRWEQEQQRAAVKLHEHLREQESVGASGSTAPGFAAPPGRTFRAWIKYDGIHETEFLQLTDECMDGDNDRYLAFANEERTHAVQTHIHKLLLRGRCRIYAYKVANTNYPMSALAASKYHDLHDKLAVDKHCRDRLDPWTASLVDTWPDTREADCQAMLLATNIDVEFNNYSSELHHSQFRRFSVMRSCQCRGVNLDLANAHDILRENELQGRLRARWDQQRRPTPEDHEARHEDDDGEAPLATSVKKR